MEQVKSLWSALSVGRKLALVGGFVGTFAAVLGIAKMAATPDLALLYGGLDARSAGAVLAEVEQRGIAHEVRGEAVYVDAVERDGLRMALAAQGLPANASAGYELLDSLSGFGTTSQMFDAAYWRAKEGELARTILANPRVERARVHIASPPSSPFAEDEEPTASISVTLKDGRLRERTAESFRFLVAAAVGGLLPENVAVIDAATGQVIAPGADRDAPGYGMDRTSEFKANVERLLRARVGAENAVVEVTVEPVAQSEVILERRIDPESRVAISTNVEEVTTSEQNAGGNGVTVASNLPDGDGAEEGRQSQRQNSETRSITNYEISETTREVEISAGTIKRLSAAVLINRDVLAKDPETRSAELEQIRALVSSAIGFDGGRGDVLTVEALPFSAVAETGTAAATPAGDLLGVPLATLLPLGMLAIVALALGLFVVRPILRGVEQPALETGPLELLTEPATSAQEEKMASSSQDLIDGDVTLATSEVPKLAAPEGRGAAGKVPDEDAASVDNVSQLKGAIDARQSDTLAVLKSWLEDETEEVV